MDNIFEYYLTLLQVQMAVLGIVVAGLVTLMQILSGVVPKRQIKMLASTWELGTYILLLTLLVLIMALGTWTTAFSTPEAALTSFFLNSATGITLLLLSLGSLLWFIYLVFRTKRLLDPKLYLTHYVKTTPPKLVRAYIQRIYKGSTHSHGSDTSGTTLEKIYDPFQPIREYIKHNAQQQYDYGTATGLSLFNQLFDKTFTSISRSANHQDYVYLAKYFTASATEFFRVFHKVASEKRKFDIIHLMHKKGRKFVEAREDECLLIIIRGLEEIGTISHDEHEIVDITECIRDLTDTYLAAHEDASWKNIAKVFEEICLSMTRLAESYYLQSDNPLRSVTLISFYTGKTKDVSISLVKFFTAYRLLADLRKDAEPKLYFEAVESMCEILFARIYAIKQNGKSAIGLNSYYHNLAAELYDIYYQFSLEAIEHNRPDLLGLSLGNLRRIIKSASGLKLTSERALLTTMIIEITARSLVIIGDQKTKGERTVSMYTIETLGKHATKKDITVGFEHLAAIETIDSAHKSIRTLKTKLTRAK